MGVCKKCLKKEACFERDEHWRCTEYKTLEDVREEIESLNQSFKASGAADPEDGSAGREGAVRGDEAGSP